MTSAEDDWDDEDSKDVWLPSPEVSRFLDVKTALVDAGYRIVTARIFDEHPVWFFLLNSSQAPKLGRHDEPVRHLRNVLWGAGLRYRNEDAIIQACGRNRIQFSILWRVPASGVERDMAWERWPLQELLDQLP